ncbi:LOW QUALITY PROTEIN: hypothetical protein V2J09_004333 [Rumex salicifolius]
MDDPNPDKHDPILTTPRPTTLLLLGRSSQHRHPPHQHHPNYHSMHKDPSTKLHPPTLIVASSDVFEALYGLKQPPRAWYQRFAKFDIGFYGSKVDPSLFVYNRGLDCAHLLVYVNDIILTTSSKPLCITLLCLLVVNFPCRTWGHFTIFLVSPCLICHPVSFLVTKGMLLTSSTAPTCLPTNRARHLSTPVQSWEPPRANQLRTHPSILVPYNTLPSLDRISAMSVAFICMIREKNTSPP